MLPSSGRPLIKTPARAPANWPRPRVMIDSCSLAPAVDAGSQTVASIGRAAGGWTRRLEVLRFRRLVLLTRLPRCECDRRGHTGVGYELSRPLLRPTTADVGLTVDFAHEQSRCRRLLSVSIRRDVACPDRRGRRLTRFAAVLIHRPGVFRIVPT